LGNAIYAVDDPPETRMMAEEHISVAVQNDFLARQTRAKPIPALAELIWNGLDGDATDINVELKRNDLAGELSQIIIYDNGDGFSRQDANELFGNLGGSWKRATRQTNRFKREIHGQEGRGRYKAFALGSSVEWNVCYRAPDGNRSFIIKVLHGGLSDVTIGDEKAAPDRPTGVVVTISDLWKDYRLLETNDSIQDLTEMFALYLINYNNVRVSIAGVTIDPASAIASQTTLTLAVIADQEDSHKVELQIIEWKSQTKRVLYLCTSSGFPVDQVDTRFHVGSFSFSAYVKSTFFDKMQKEGRIGLAELEPVVHSFIESAREAIKVYFQEREAEKARSIVDEWKERDVYPYRGEPQSTVEKAERQVFDIVAVRLQEVAPDIGAGSETSKAFHLRMLRSAIERGPDELQTIMKEVLNLPAKEQKELAALLLETTLSAIITAAKTVADRLKFISALESIIFNTDTKARLKERSQLHKILAENTWVFGETYNLWVNDKDLKNVLVIDDPVKVIGKSRGIVDLMFSRTTRQHRADDIEQLVVELKAPRVKIGANEIVQANKYAMAVSNDERFRTVGGVRWHFWLVSNDYDDYAKGAIEGGPDQKGRLIWRKDNVTVGIKTWGELIEENRARLQFFQEHLQHNATESLAIEHLQERHRKLLEGVIVDGTDDEDDEGEEEKNAG
jgi:hypothetical protein